VRLSAGNDGHCWRVAAYVDELVRVLGLAPYQSAFFVDAARLHDIGAVDLPTEVLTQPNPLSEQDWTLVGTHVVRGAVRLAQLPETSPLTKVVLCHHERVDGSGYPGPLRRGKTTLETGMLEWSTFLLARNLSRGQETTAMSIQTPPFPGSGATFAIRSLLSIAPLSREA
jgi:hypothetical protein